MFEDKKVKANSVSDFLKKYYREDRYTGRGKEYAATLLASYEEEFKEYGYCIISKHDSKSGDVCAFFGKNK